MRYKRIENAQAKKCQSLVNAWMNSPAGFRLVNGRLQAVDPWGAVLNQAMPVEVTHMLLADSTAPYGS